METFSKTKGFCQLLFTKVVTLRAGTKIKFVEGCLLTIKGLEGIGRQMSETSDGYTEINGLSHLEPNYSGFLAEGWKCRGSFICFQNRFSSSPPSPLPPRQQRLQPFSLHCDNFLADSSCSTTINASSTRFSELLYIGLHHWHIPRDLIIMYSRVVLICV
ncbi:uncharacterized protein [Malus domestica]|uniref:uncharacterized protein isoform X3 n=1 Tax=Malus domestica TaxID=3750 RepID=UPI003976F99C